jgi:hypothetical protein
MWCRGGSSMWRLGSENCCCVGFQLSRRGMGGSLTLQRVVCSPSVHVTACACYIHSVTWCNLASTAPHPAPPLLGWTGPQVPSRLAARFGASALTQGGTTLTALGLDLLSQLLAWDPDKRISAEAALRHK